MTDGPPWPDRYGTAPCVSSCRYGEHYCPRPGPPRDHEHDAGCSFGSPTCPAYAEVHLFRPEAPSVHDCALPRDADYRTDEPEGTLAYCPVCDRWWRSAGTPTTGCCTG